MSDELLPYYNSELAFVRELLRKEFAEAHPKMAARLGIGAVDREESTDPHVRRLIEAVAYLNARIRYKLDDDFPEISDALLGVLYPHYLTPVPSLAIVQFQADPGLTDIFDHLPKNTELETDPVDGQPYRFRTCYPVALWPIRVDGAGLHERPLPAPAIAQSRNAQGVLRLELRCHNDDLSFAKLGLSGPCEKLEKLPLRFFLKGQEQHVYPLYDLLCNSLLQVVLANGDNDPEPVPLGPDCLRPMGFAGEEGLLPYPARSFLGYRLLTEFFVFPEKFLFLELLLDKSYLNRFGNRLNIYFYCAVCPAELQRAINADTFALGCTPVVNLFEQWADQGLFNHTQPEYEVTPSERHRNTMEVYSINAVSASDDAGRVFEFQPLYGAHHSHDARHRQFWFASRRPARHHSGTDTFLKLVDLDFSPSRSSEQTLHVKLTCLNHNLPSLLPFGGDQPHLQLRESAAPLKRIACLTKPTPSFRPPLGQGAVWRLISHLTLNLLSITDAAQGAEALREILGLYDYKSSHPTRGQIQGVDWVESGLTTCRLPGSGFDTICQGVAVHVGIDQERFEGKSVRLFARVLDHFLALYCSINSFTQLKVYDKSDKLKKEPLVQCRPRSGEHPLL